MEDQKANLQLDYLEKIIKQVDIAKKSYDDLRYSYNDLKDSFEELIEFSPNALLILNKDKSIYIQNTKAKELSFLLDIIDIKDKDYELEYKNNVYLIKNTKYKDKTLLNITDISEQRQKDRLIVMGQMAAHLSHEIRNPIGSISLISSSLLKKVDINNKTLVLEIKKAVFRIERIVKSTLMFVKGLNIQKEKFNLNKIKEELENSINYYSFSKDININISLPNKNILADEDLINIMLSNLLFNSIDAIEESKNEKGEIKITYKTDKKYHIFTIYDNGKEIENKEILFKAFKSTKQKGNGLGLILSRQIANAHGGDINLEKDKKTFKIYIKKQ